MIETIYQILRRTSRPSARSLRPVATRTVGSVAECQLQVVSRAAGSVPDTVVEPPPPTPRRPYYRDPYAGVVTGSQLVERTRWVHAWHQARWGDNDGWPEIEWGPFNKEDI